MESVTALIIFLILVVINGTLQWIVGADAKNELLQEIKKVAEDLKKSENYHDPTKKQLSFTYFR
jgi:hypothetical protein